ncbi:MAG TPA: hypothetical protein VM534_08595 [Thermoanaerobaculia bacterium]|nr:hypothetical protein [Thermoanaerobaculia bacterium]
MERILFVCIGNICRSPIAEAITREKQRGRARVESAGIAALEGHPPPPEAIEAAREHGLDLTAHRARFAGDLDLESYDRIIALTPAIAARLIETFRVAAEKLLVLDIEDPYGDDLDAYRACVSQLDEALGLHFPESFDRGGR